MKDGTTQSSTGTGNQSQSSIPVNKDSSPVSNTNEEKKQTRKNSEFSNQVSFASDPGVAFRAAAISFMVFFVVVWGYIFVKELLAFEKLPVFSQYMGSTDCHLGGVVLAFEVFLGTIPFALSIAAYQSSRWKMQNRLLGPVCSGSLGLWDKVLLAEGYWYGYYATFLVIHKDVKGTLGVNRIPGDKNNLFIWEVVLCLLLAFALFFWRKCLCNQERLAAEEDQNRTNEANAAVEYVLENVFAYMVEIPERNFLMSKTPLTQTVWSVIMRNNPSRFQNGDNPVDNVSWYDCKQFLKKINSYEIVKNAGFEFRLPTEDEWMFAYRADGHETEEGLNNPAALQETAWFLENSGNGTHPVAQLKPNAFGLFDMLGNVWEWTQSGDAQHRVVCGGSWNRSKEKFAVDLKKSLIPDKADSNIGFRLCADRRVN